MIAPEMDGCVDAELQKLLVNAHRVGEEGLCGLLVEKNLLALERYRLETMLTTDAHLFNLPSKE